MSIRYTKPEDVEYEAEVSPEGERVFGYVTEEVPFSGTFGEAVHELVKADITGFYPLQSGPILITTEAHWSGYSEYTITNQWSEIVLTVPKRNWEKRWPSLGDFLRALADANPQADR